MNQSPYNLKPATKNRNTIIRLVREIAFNTFVFNIYYIIYLYRFPYTMHQMQCQKTPHTRSHTLSFSHFIALASKSHIIPCCILRTNSYRTYCCCCAHSPPSSRPCAAATRYGRPPHRWPRSKPAAVPSDVADADQPQSHPKH